MFVYMAMPVLQFVSVRINIEKIEIPLQGQVDKTCYPESLLAKAVIRWLSPRLLVSQTVATGERQASIYLD